MSDVATTLQEIKGIGPATRTAVLDAYPTLDSIDKASLEDLEAIKGVGPATAKAIKSAVAKAEKKTAGQRSKRAAKEASTKSRKAASGARRSAKGTSDATREAAKDVSAAGKKASSEIGDAAQDAVEGTVVELREGRGKVGDQADNTVQQVKAALTSIQNVITAALDAGKESLPEAQRQLKAAGTSLRKLGPTIVEAVEKAREDRNDKTA